MILDRGADGRYGDLRGQFDRIAVDAGADAREGQRGEAMLPGELDGGAIARGEELGLALATAVPDRADRVNHVSRGEAIAPRDPGLAGLAAAEAATFLQELRPRRAMDGPVHSAAAQQRGFGFVGYGVHRERGDVGLDRAESRGHAACPTRSGGRDVGVHPEEIPRVVDGLELTQARVVLAEGGADLLGL